MIAVVRAIAGDKKAEPLDVFPWRKDSKRESVIERMKEFAEVTKKNG